MKIQNKVMKNHRTGQNFKAAFTLVELLVVITIIVVLAGLLFSLTSKMKNRASSAISLSNLRQVAAAIMASASDNNSNLPGPTLTDQLARYQDNAASGQLGWLLKDYLVSEPQPDNPQPRWFYTPGLDYPAAKTDAKNPKSANKPSYVVNLLPADINTGARYYPLGNYNKNSAGNTTPPMNTMQLSAREFRGIPWITETDQVIRPSASRYGVEKTPPHGSYRNTLMFDFSVKAVPIGEFKTSL